MNALHTALSNQSSLKVSILLDYFRGTRGSPNSVDLLWKLKRDFGDRCAFKFYKTPNMSPLLEKWAPQRWNEALGLQHIKAYAFDDGSCFICGLLSFRDYPKRVSILDLLTCKSQSEQGLLYKSPGSLSSF